MNTDTKPDGPNEQALVKLYMELTGASEGRARGVVMHVCAEGQANAVLSSEVIIDSAVEPSKE